jgi:hydroxyacylglutathione hydrolase
VTDHVRGDEPWLVLSGDSLLIGDAGRPDLHAGDAGSTEELARALYRSLHDALLALPDHVLLYPAHYSGSVCGRGLSANPVSSVGFERRSNPLLALGEDEFVAALLKDIPPAPPDQAAIIAANRTGGVPVSAR